MTENLPSTSSDNLTQCAYVGVFGLPNAGKSTLVNRMVGEKVAIVSPKPQTTRRRVRGVWTEGDTQIIFADTPGLFQPNAKNPLEKFIVANATEELSSVDVRLLAIDAQKGLTDEALALVDKVGALRGENIAVLNKIDAIPDKTTLLAQAKILSERANFSRIFMTSARKGHGADDIVAYLRSVAPKGPFMFDPERVTDAPLFFDMAETTRECLFHALRQELPYGVAVLTEKVERREDAGAMIVHQTVYTVREAHKKVILGAGGAVIKRVGSKSRELLKKQLDVDVHLYLHVKVKENWQHNPLFLAECS
ncbi:MAG: GTPase Era [Rickettsiales bacterium]